MFFWNYLAFSMIQWMLAIWSLVPLPFLNPAWTSGSLQFRYTWSLAWRILSITLLMWDECNCGVVWAFFGIAFLWDWNENVIMKIKWDIARKILWWCLAIDKKQNIYILAPIFIIFLFHYPSFLPCATSSSLIFMLFACMGNSSLPV